MLATTNNSFCYLIEWQAKEKKKTRMEKMQDDENDNSGSGNKKRSHEIANGKFETETENKQTMNSIEVAECFAMDSDFFVFSLSLHLSF